MRKQLLVLLLSLLTCFVQAEPEIKGNPEELKDFLYPTENVVTINGYADEKVYSDQAIVTLVVTTESELLSAAISKNSSLRSQIAKSLIEANIPAEQIKSSKFSSTPQFSWFGKKPSSYKVVNRMAITLQQEEQLKKVAALSDKFEEVEFSDTVFEHSQEDECRKKLKAEALEKIIEQKKFYETTLGLKLSPIGIKDFDLSQAGTQGAMLLNEAVFGAAKQGYEGDSKFASRSLVQQTTTSFDELKYEARLSVDFKIEP